MRKITHQLILVLLLTVLTACECLAYEQLTDTDWNISFYNKAGVPVTDGEPHFKFGIYRPGGKEFSGTKTSIADFDEFILEIIKKK